MGLPWKRSSVAGFTVLSGSRLPTVWISRIGQAGAGRTSLFSLRPGHLLVVRTPFRSPSDDSIADRISSSWCGTPMNKFPAGEQRISEVERGRSCRAIVPLPHGETISAGDTVLFALSHARPGQQPAYVDEGDSVLVCLTDVTDIGRIDPASGQALVQLTWKPLGQCDPPASVSMRAMRLGSRGRG